MASIVKRGKSYSVVYSTYTNGVHKQKWETYHSEDEALRRKEVVESWLRIRQKKTIGKIETVEQLVWANVRLYGKSRWSLSMYDSSLGLIKICSAAISGTGADPYIIGQLQGLAVEIGPRTGICLYTAGGGIACADVGRHRLG